MFSFKINDYYPVDSTVEALAAAVSALHDFGSVTVEVRCRDHVNVCEFDNQGLLVDFLRTCYELEEASLDRWVG